MVTTGEKEGAVVLGIYENIKKRRLELGMTQTQLAELAGYADRSAIAKIESGASKISQPKIVALAEALQVTPSELFGLSDESEPAIDPIELVRQKYGEDARELIELYLKLNEAGRKKILQDLRDVVDLPRYTEELKKEMKMA
jgi:transcriptional regulator with XRE-family HTH domain